MQILNTTTNEIVTLSYAPTGCDCLPDLIAGSLIQYNPDEDRYEAPAIEIEFWSDWIAAAEKADGLEAALAEKLGDKMAALEVSIVAASEVEFNDQPAARIDALHAALIQTNTVTEKNTKQSMIETANVNTPQSPARPVLEVLISTNEGEKFISVRHPDSDCGCDFYESGEELEWQDNNGLLSNCSADIIAKARDAAEKALA